MRKKNNVKIRFNISVDFKKREWLIFDKINKKEYRIGGCFVSVFDGKELRLSKNGCRCYILKTIEDQIEEIEDQIEELKEELNNSELYVSSSREQYFFYYTELKKIYNLDKKGTKIIIRKSPGLWATPTTTIENKFATENNPEDFNLTCEDIIKVYGV